MINIILTIVLLISLFGVIGEKEDEKLRFYLFIICCCSVISLGIYTLF